MGRSPAEVLKSVAPVLARRILGKIVLVRGTLGDLCWVWRTQEHRYGTLHWNKKSHMAHRFIYELVIGPIPEGQLLRHKCNNRRCANPYHQIPGTQKGNMLDLHKRRAESRRIVAKNAEMILRRVRRGREPWALADELGVLEGEVMALVNGDDKASGAYLRKLEKCVRTGVYT